MKLVFVQHLLTFVIHLSKNRFLSKLSKNGQFLLNEVKKIRNDEIFLTKYKMLRMYDFHIDFQFQVKKLLPRDFQMA